MKNVLRLTIAAVVLACGMIFSSALLSKLFIRIRHEQTISVKGYAEKDLVSDIGKFSCSYSSRGANLNKAYAGLQKSKNLTIEYLERKGFPDADISVETIRISRLYEQDAKGYKINEIEYYDVSQSIYVTSQNVVLVREVSRNITELIKEGIDISASPPQFYVSALESTKVELLAQATADGYHRAETLAQNSRGKVGALISARQGVFQVTARNSTQTSGYGVYDTSTIEKTLKAVVTLEYAIKP